MDAGDPQTLVVVGNGMASFRLCRRLVECGAAPGPLRLVVFGEEPRPAYDRIRLTEILSGRAEEDLWLASPRWYRDHDIDLVLGDRVVSIDRDACAVRSAAGVTVPFDRLVLATGSRPFVPPVPGTDLPGVFVYRTIDDLHAILAWARSAGRAAVIGGGLLGLEAARALLDLGLEVHVLEASRGLLPRQLDEIGARLLGERIEALGVEVHLGARTTRIERAGPGLVLSLEDRGRLAVDLVVLSAGIRPRGELGHAAGLATTGSGGVVVDDHLTTSDPRIFAVGECAAHRGVAYGLAVPGYRMVDVLVDNLVGGDAAFMGADRSVRLKLLGVCVAALGRYQEAPGVQAHTYLAGGAYRKLLVRDDRIVGALAVGDWEDLDRVREALAEPRRFSFWDLRRFRSTGSLWLASESPPVREWAAEALVCGCLGVRRGALCEAEAEGCVTVEALSLRTGAGTLCGACRPLLADLLRRGREQEDTPPTLRCSGLPAPPNEPALPSEPAPPRSAPPRSVSPWSGPPRSSRPAIFLPARDVAALHGAPGARAELATLPSAELEPISPDGKPQGSMRRARTAPLIDDPPTPTSPSFPLSRGDPAGEPPASSAPLSAPPVSSRRDLMAPLRPVSVPPSALSGRPSGRLPPPSIAAPPSAGASRRGALLATSVVSLGGAATLALTPAATPARSFRGAHVETVWTRRSSKEATGYATIALALMGLVLTVRKRTRRLHRADVAGLRVVHGALGSAALLAFACHTGLRAGERLDLLLWGDLLAASAIGGVAAAAVALGDPAAAQARRLLATRAHLYLLLPLPVLVALHVLGAYYF